MSGSSLYVSLSEKDLVEMRDDLVKVLRKAQRDGRISSIGGAGKSMGKQMLTLGELKSELRDVQYALGKKDSKKFHRPGTSMLQADFSRRGHTC